MCQVKFVNALVVCLNLKQTNLQKFVVLIKVKAM